MKRTNKYQLSYFEKGDTTSPVYEVQRWVTIDTQLQALFSVVGNGVLTGWELSAGEGLSTVVSAGSGHVAFVSVSSTDNYTINNLSPSSRNYIYAQLEEDSYWTKSVIFGAYLTTNNADNNSLYIGYVDTDDTTVTGVSTTGRDTLGFSTLIQEMISEHKHIGGTDNPSPINLATDVQGVLNQNNLPDIDASLITTGTIDANRLPKIDHTTKLTNVGALTHAQLDSYIEQLNLTNKSLMGEVSTTNLLQLILALKHAYPDIDEYLVNAISYIPGISPDSFVDWTNTTATVDTLTHAAGGTHTISGEAVTGLTLYTHVWDTEDDFNDSTSSNILVDGNSVTLNTTRNTLVLDNFSDVSQWEVLTNDLSSLTSQMTKGTTGGNVVVTSTDVDVTLTIQKEFDAQDWSDYKYLVFYIKTENVDHGDIYFYFRDSVYGVQNSYTLILNRNTPTVNVDTLDNGWQEITIDISSYSRSSVNLMAFYTSTQDGWDSSKALDFSIDNIYLSTGNIYEENGYIRVIFGSDFLYRFWKIRWDAIVPADTGIELKSRCRAANSQAALPLAPWTDYATASGTVIPFDPDVFYKYVEVEMYFSSSDDFTRAPFLTKLYLDFYLNDTDSQFSLDTQADWRTGNSYNIDNESTPGSIKVSNTEDIDTYYYGTNGEVAQIDSDLEDLYVSAGTSLPRTTYQAKNSIAPAFGLVTGVYRGNNGHIWISDIDNDRVVELDKYGALVKGYYGSFLSVPNDPYGTEENGPGSNTDVSSSTTTSTAPESINVLHSIYNSETGILYVVFDSNLENIYDSNTNFDLNKIYIKVGAQKILLNDATAELLGVDETKYNDWYPILQANNEYASFINQFSFSSHVLKIQVNGADRTFLDYLVNQKLPTITINSPYQQRRYSTSTVQIEMSLANCTLGTDTGEYSIRIRINSGAWSTIYTDKCTFSGLASNNYTVDVQLVDDTSTPVTTLGAEASVSFVVYAATYSQPYLSIISPKQNQVYSSSPVQIEFNCENFPIIPSGQHIKYVVDSDPAVDYNSTEPIEIEDLEHGEHTIRLYTVDENGDQLVYTYGDVTGTFIIGNNPNAIPKLYVDYGAIYDSTKEAPVNASRTYLDVGNIYFANIYSPIDIQVIPYDNNGLGSGYPTVLISKMRSPSWNNYLGNSERALELVNRIAKEATNSSDITLNTSLSSLSDLDLIYSTKYLDGHSVIQLDKDGNTVFSNNAAKFSDTKDNAKDTLGSAEKIGSNELLIADSINQRAIITYTNLTTKVPQVTWQYDSDRNVVDFHINNSVQKYIDVYDGYISESASFIRQGTSVTWTNKSSSSISIYSGTTTYDIFNLDPDLTLYGNEFYSPTLAVGESYTYTFNTIGDFDWFVYPDIITGEINVTENRLSSKDQFYILESDGEESPFTSRLIRVDTWGNVVWSFGETYLVKPRDIRPMLNGNILIST